MFLVLYQIQWDKKVIYCAAGCFMYFNIIVPLPTAQTAVIF